MKIHKDWDRGISHLTKEGVKTRVLVKFLFVFVCDANVVLVVVSIMVCFEDVLSSMQNK